MARVFFIADTHFLHANIIKYCNRPFETVEEMDEFMISTWNATVSEGDTVYHLGDFALPNRRLPHQEQEASVRRILNRLNGHVILIRGSHDYYPDVFEKCYDIHLIKIGGRRVVLCHYPMLSWPYSHYGSLMLHGHHHGRLEIFRETLYSLLPDLKNQMDVGIDLHGFRPLCSEEVLHHIRQRYQ